MFTMVLWCDIKLQYLAMLSWLYIQQQFWSAAVQCFLHRLVISSITAIAVWCDCWIHQQLFLFMRYNIGNSKMCLFLILCQAAAEKFSWFNADYIDWTWKKAWKAGFTLYNTVQWTHHDGDELFNSSIWYTGVIAAYNG